VRSIQKKNCFVICPIGERDSEERKHADEVINRIVKPIVEKFEYNVIRADEYQVGGQITHQIVNLIAESDLVIADLSFCNFNVSYELALRHITRKPFIHLIKEESKIPFDIKDIRAIKFDLNKKDSIKRAKRELEEQIRNIEKGEFGTIRYISTLLGKFEIIFSALKYFASDVGGGLVEDNSRQKFGGRSYRDVVIRYLDYSESEGRELELENVHAIRIDASNIKLGKLHIKRCMINHIDISESEIDRLDIKDTKINVMDASKSKITIFIKKRVEFINPPDFYEAEILEEVD